MTEFRSVASKPVQIKRRFHTLNSDLLFHAKKTKHTITNVTTIYDVFTIASWDKTGLGIYKDFGRQKIVKKRTEFIKIHPKSTMLFCIYILNIQ